jgi:uncharacterized alpha-E superfamily protein
VLARHAENLFWTGRHLERAEDTARLLDVTYHGLLESPPSEARAAWRNLLAMLRLDQSFFDVHDEATAAAVTHFLVLDADNPSSIVSAVDRARGNARALRELISTELWLVINGFYLELRSRDLAADLEGQPYQLYGLVKARAQAIAGVAAETMTRDDGWRFLMLGWMLERAEMTCRLLNVRLAQVADQPLSLPHLLVDLLKSASALEACRRHVRGSLDLERVLEFLIFSPDFPRSVLFCVQAAEEQLAQLAPIGRINRPHRLLGRLRAELEFRDVTELLGEDLHAFFENVQSVVREVGDAVSLQFFRLGGDAELQLLGMA